MPLDLSRLDPEQRAAVTAPDGPVLVFAGAGSGKTRTLTARIAHLVLDRGVPGSGILAVTFTRKAADEMRNRLRRLALNEPGAPFAGLRVGTFHATLANLLRGETPEILATLGRTRDFTVWDEDDRRRAMGTIIRERGIETVSPARAIELMSSYKNDALSYAEADQKAHDLDEYVTLSLWRDYDRLAERSNALDFDDLLTLPVRLMREQEDVRLRWSGTIRHLLVDEFQDTNRIQLALCDLLTSVHRNLFVVGDDAQSIYRFRGARIENILEFRDRHPGATAVTLATNYRSTSYICDLANAVLAGSKLNVKKTLRAHGGVTPGASRPSFRAFRDDRAEAEFVVRQVNRMLTANVPPSEIAILLRTNPQTRVIEQALVREGIDYVVLGGTKFFEREEIRDLVAYLRCLLNPHDGIAFRRALAKPSGRGIGDKLIDAVNTATLLLGQTWPEAMRDQGNGDLSRLADYLVSEVERGLPSPNDPEWRAQLVALAPELGSLLGDIARAAVTACDKIGEQADWRAAVRAAAKPIGTAKGRASLLAFLELCDDWRDAAARKPVSFLIKQVVVEAGLAEAYNDGTIEGGAKADNLDEAPNAAEGFGPGELTRFLETAVLDSEVGAKKTADGSAVSLATLHAAKGLEWGAVFLAGCEENLLPHRRSTTFDELEEERRLLYVGVTRAKRQLVLSAALARSVHGGGAEPTAVSRFVIEVREALDGQLTPAENGPRPSQGYRAGRPLGSPGRPQLSRRAG